jgi:hypothetical protein
MEVRFFGQVTRISLGWGLTVWVGLTLITGLVAAAHVVLYSIPMWWSQGSLATLIGPGSWVIRFVIVMMALIWAHVTKQLIRGLTILLKTWEAGGRGFLKLVPGVEYPEELEEGLEGLLADMETMQRSGRTAWALLVAMPVWPTLLMLPMWSLADWVRQDTTTTTAEEGGEEGSATLGEDRPWVRRGVVYVLVICCIAMYGMYLLGPFVTEDLTQQSYRFAESVRDRVVTFVSGIARENEASAAEVYRETTRDTVFFQMDGAELVPRYTVKAGTQILLADPREKGMRPVDGAQLMAEVVGPRAFPPPEENEEGESQAILRAAYPGFIALNSQREETPGPIFVPGLSLVGYVPWADTKPWTPTPTARHPVPQSREEPRPPLAEVVRAAAPEEPETGLQFAGQFRLENWMNEGRDIAVFHHGQEDEPDVVLYAGDWRMLDIHPSVQDYDVHFWDAENNRRLGKIRTIHDPTPGRRYRIE